MSSTSGLEFSTSGPSNSARPAPKFSKSTKRHVKSKAQQQVDEELENAPVSSSDDRNQQLQRMLFLIDKLIHPAMNTQDFAIRQIRIDLERANLAWEREKLIADALKLTQDTLKWEVLHKAVKLVACYQRLLEMCGDLLKDEILVKEKVEEKVEEEARYMEQLDEAVRMLDRIEIAE